MTMPPVLTATAVPDGLLGLLLLIAIAALVHEPWRWLGVALGRDVEIGSPIFEWVRAVATALVAALVMRLALFPAGALAAVPTGVRVAGLAIGVAVYLLAGRSLARAVLAGACVLVVGDRLFGGPS
jgi:branched-subunit amino acid transport protein